MLIDYIFLFILSIYLEYTDQKITMNCNKEYDSPVANIKWDKRGFFVFTLKNTNAIYDKEETINQFNYFLEQSNGEPYKVLMDSTDSLVFPTDCAFEYFFEKNKEENTTAIIATSLPMQIYLYRQ